jgi:tetratricopeptide (TPR) repeat protein/tRNA A-37 threonylcarbamoyl transferase component Bud32
MTGTIVSHYEVLERLGCGGMGVVYKARDQRLGRFVALKFLHPNITADDQIKRFILEAQAASALEHSNICTIYEIDQTGDGQMFIAMAFYGGETLQKKLMRGPLPVEEAMEVARQAARGLAKAHDSGIVHRDINPANLIIDDGVVKILDFGAAIVKGAARLTKIGTTLGTLPYMSPEQLRGQRQVDQRTDIWSLGTVLYEMLAGRLPFAEEYEQSLIYSILNEDPEPLKTACAELPGALGECICKKALAKDPAERYQRMQELAADLEQLERDWQSTVAGRRPVKVRSSSTPVTAASSARAATSRHWGKVLPALAAVLLATTAFWPPARVALLSAACQVAPGVLGYCRIPDFRHVCVMPFESDGANQEDVLLAEGLSASLQRQLARLERFDRSICVHGPRREGPQFGMNLLVGGRLRRNGERLELSVEVKSPASSAVVRAFEVQALRNDVSLLQLIQDGLVQRLAQALEIETPDDRLAVVAAGGTGIAAAYDSYLQGMGHLERNDTEPAIAAFEQALKQDSFYPLAHAALGDAAWRQFNVTKDRAWQDRATQSYLHAISKRDELPEAHIGLGRIHAGAGRNAQAVEEFRRALELDPLDTGARQDLVVAYEAERRLQEARAVYQAEIELRPKCWQKYLLLGLFYWRNGCSDEAERQLRRVIELAPDNRPAYTNLAAVYLHSGRLEDAEKVSLRALEIAPGSQANLNLAHVYFRQRRYAEAAEKIDAAIELGAGGYEVWGIRAEAYRMAPHLKNRAPALFQRAVELAKDELTKRPLDPEVWAMLANHYARLEQPDEARKAARTALEIAPDNPNVLFRAALVFEMTGNRERAMQLLGAALMGGYSIEEARSCEALDGIRQTHEYQTLEQEIAPSWRERTCPMTDGAAALMK